MRDTEVLEMPVLGTGEGNTNGASGRASPWDSAPSMNSASETPLFSCSCARQRRQA